MPEGLVTAPAGRELLRGVPRSLAFGLGGLLVFAGLCAVLMQGRVGPAALLALWGQARVAPLLLGAALLFGGLVGMALRWRALLPGGGRVGLLWLTGICAVGQLLNFSLPGPVGEVAAAGLVQRRHGIEAPVALAASLHARFVGVLSAAAFTVLIWFFGGLRVPDEARAFAVGAVALVAAWTAVMGSVAVFPNLVLAPCAALERRLAGSRGGRLSERLGRAVGLVRRFTAALSGLGRHPGRAHLRALGWNLAGLACISVGSWLVVRALGGSCGLLALVFAHSAVTVGAVMLVAVPGAHVGWDAAFAALLVGVVGLPLELALSVTLLVHLQQIAIMGLGGVALWVELRSHGPARVDALATGSG